MKNTIKELVASGIHTGGECTGPGKVLVLTFGGSMWENTQTIAGKIGQTWGISRDQMMLHSIVAAEEAIAQYDDISVINVGDGIPDGDVIALNRVALQLADAFVQMGDANGVICGMVYAHDRLARWAPDVMCLVGKWYERRCGGIRQMPRLMLSVVLADEAEFDDEDVFYAKALQQRICTTAQMRFFVPTPLKSEPQIKTLHETDVPLAVFLLDAMCDRDVISNTVYLMAGGVGAESGLFVPAFHDLTEPIVQCVARQCISCFEQLGPETPETDIVDTWITNKLCEIVNNEMQEVPFEQWMQRACILRVRPAGNQSEYELYGNWLEQLCAQWCTRFLNKELPVAQLRRLVSGAQPEELRGYKLALNRFRCTESGMVGRWHPETTEWRRQLQEAVQSKYVPMVHEVFCQRVNRMTGEMLGMITERLNKTSPQSPASVDLQAELKKVIRGTDADWNFRAHMMDATQKEHFMHYVQNLRNGGQSGLEKLLQFVLELLPEPQQEDFGGSQQPAMLCRAHFYTDISKRFVRRCGITAGERKGQYLYTLALSRGTEANGLHPAFLSFFENL